MREVSFYWKRAHAEHLASGPLTKVFQSLQFLSYARRVPNDIRCIFKAHFQTGKGPKDLKSVGFLELLEVLMEPENESDGTVLLLRIHHPAANLSARLNGTTAVPGACFLDAEGLTYTLQGPPIKLRLLSGFLRMFAKPDRTSARTVEFTASEDNGALTHKQLKLAKFAYDRGYFDTPKRIRIAELSQELGLARATISEHMARIESAIMDDMFSSFSDVYLAPETLREILKLADDDQDEVENPHSDGFRKLMRQIQSSIEDEIATMKARDEEADIDIEALIQESMNQHEGNISFIDDVLALRNNGLEQS